MSEDSNSLSLSIMRVELLVLVETIERAQVVIERQKKHDNNCTIAPVQLFQRHVLLQYGLVKNAWPSHSGKQTLDEMIAQVKRITKALRGVSNTGIEQTSLTLCYLCHSQRPLALHQTNSLISGNASGTRCCNEWRGKDMKM